MQTFCWKPPSGWGHLEDVCFEVSFILLCRVKQRSKGHGFSWVPEDKKQPRRLTVNTAVGLTAVCVVNRLRAAMYRLRIPTAARDFSFLQYVHTNSGAHSISKFFSRGKAVRGVKCTIRLYLVTSLKLKDFYTSTPLPHKPSRRLLKRHFLYSF